MRREAFAALMWQQQQGIRLLRDLLSQAGLAGVASTTGAVTGEETVAAAIAEAEEFGSPTARSRSRSKSRGGAEARTPPPATTSQRRRKKRPVPADALSDSSTEWEDDEVRQIAFERAAAQQHRTLSLLRGACVRYAVPVPIATSEMVQMMADQGAAMLSAAQGGAHGFGMVA